MDTFFYFLIFLAVLSKGAFKYYVSIGGGEGGSQPIAYIGLQGGGGSQELVKNDLRNTWTVPNVEENG